MSRYETSDIKSLSQKELQMNASLIHLEHDIGQRLGQQTLEKLQHNGVDLVRNGRELLIKLVAQVHESFDFYPSEPKNQTPDDSILEFETLSSRYCNADRPHYVEDGYIYLQLSEQKILRYFLQQKIIYRTMLEELTNHIVRYLEKIYYHIEQHWQEFQSHYMTFKNPSASHLQDMEHLEDVSLDMLPVGVTVPMDPPPSMDSSPITAPQETAMQIAHRHRRIQQLQSIGRSFWQDNFLSALGQIQLDLLEWSPAPEPPTHKREVKLGMPIHYIPILKELEQLCHIDQLRHKLLQHLRKQLEKKSHACHFGMELIHSPVEYENFCYSEYPDTEESQLPDELVKISLQYVHHRSYQHLESQQEEHFMVLSQHIHKFFSQVEKSTRFHRMKILPLLLHSKKVSEKDNTFALEANAAVDELLQKPDWVDSSFLQNHHYEAQILLELLQKADIALQYQLQFHTSRKHYKLLKEMQQLRRKLLTLCRQPQFWHCHRNRSIPQEYRYTGIQIIAQYRTVLKRRESYHRIQEVLQKFITECQNTEPDLVAP